MQKLIQVSLKDAVNFEGKAIVIDSECEEIDDLRNFAPGFTFIIGRKFVTLKDAVNYAGESPVRAISPAYDEILTLDEFSEGFFFLIRTDEEEKSALPAKQEEKARRSAPKKNRDATGELAGEEEPTDIKGEDEISFIVFEDDDE